MRTILIVGETIHTIPLIASVVAAAFVAAAFGSATAATAQPRAVRLEVKTPRSGGPGTFTASGAGLCRRGATRDTIFTLPSAANHETVHLRKTFSCSDRSGTFVVEMRAHVAGTHTHASGSWKIVSGSDAYAKLEGAGNLVTDVRPATFLDHFSGTVILG